jgi:hypothetical protein
MILKPNSKAICEMIFVAQGELHELHELRVSAW